VYEDRVQVPRLQIAWPAVSVQDRDAQALEYVSDILTGSRTARLTKALVYDRQSATNANAFTNENERVGEFHVLITPRPGHTLTEIEATTDSIIERFKTEGPTADEMARSAAGLEFEFVSQLESNLGKAEILLDGMVFHGDAGYFHTEYEQLRAVTAADVKRVANKYLGANRIVLSTVPLGRAADASHPESSLKVTVGPDGGHYTMGSN
jgi:zinc protease